MESIKSRLAEVLSEKKVVYVNGRRLNYWNLFISFDDHELEALYNRVLKCNLKSTKIVDTITSNGFFVPDDLASMFRGLCTNMHELTEDTFEYMVYNTDISWFVVFTTNFMQDCSHLFKALVFFFY